MKRILVPCDFSAPSREAFKLATSIASKTKGEVIVLHTIFIPVMYDPSFVGGLPLAYDPVFRAGIEDNAKKGFAKMNVEMPTSDVKTSLEIIHGDIVSSIKQIVETKNIDLVVMGTTGASGLQEVFIGSNTEKVVRHVPVPVLAIHTAPRIDSIKKILLPTELNLDQSKFINKVKELQEFFKAALHVLLINTPSHFRPDAEAKEALEEFAKHYKLKDYVLHFRSSRNEGNGIIDFAYDSDANLIVMATHARKGLAHLFNGSITEDVVNHIQCPVWTFSAKK